MVKLESHLRQVATALLESAIRIAPTDTRNWGQAMRGELNHVEGAWAAVMWALGGAGVLTKRALASLFIPGRRGQSIPPGTGIFSKDVSVRKAALVTGGGCILAALLFFAAPPFRQALRVSLGPWYLAFQGDSGNIQPGFEALARRAEMRHDPEGLAFCAVRLQNSRESARLAEEAVRLDPNLRWVYAVVAMRHPELAQISQWMSNLERWDLSNALLHLITTESIEQAHSHRGVLSPPTEEQDQAWRSAMAVAFQSSKFDDYLERVAELNRKVVPRYRFYDPDEVLSRDELDLPTSAFKSSERFAESLLHSGEDREARGDQKGAHEKCLAVARFGQMIDSQGHTGFEHWAGTTLQAMAYKQLQAHSRIEGNPAQAALFGYLAEKFDPFTGEHSRLGGQWVFGLDISKRNAAVLKISGLMILIFSGLVVVSGSILIGGSRRGARPAGRPTRPAATMLAMVSAVGLLLSSAVLYLTYRPYWYILQSAILNGDRSQARDLHSFLDSTRILSGVPPAAYLMSPDFRFYFWVGVTLLGVTGLVFILLRHFRDLARAHGLQHSPRVL